MNQTPKFALIALWAIALLWAISPDQTPKDNTLPLMVTQAYKDLEPHQKDLTDYTYLDIIVSYEATTPKGDTIRFEKLADSLLVSANSDVALAFDTQFEQYMAHGNIHPHMLPFANLNGKTIDLPTKVTGVRYELNGRMTQPHTYKQAKHYTTYIKNTLLNRQ